MTEQQLYRDFGKNLEWLLKRYSLTQHELARALGVGKSTVSQYVNGKRCPSVPTVINIMNIIGCDFDELFDTSDFVK